MDQRESDGKMVVSAAGGDDDDDDDVRVRFGSGEGERGMKGGGGIMEVKGWIQRSAWVIGVMVQSS